MNDTPHTRLTQHIEQALGWRMRTPRDFDNLSKQIFDRLHVNLSATTLKRLWGYLGDGGQPRESTLTILARFLGYRDWADYEARQQEAADQESDPLMCRKLSVTEALRKGDRLRLTWHPDRVCDIEYLVELLFVVIASEHTRLKTGDTFECSLVMEGEPLYLDNLRQEGRPPVNYVCGKKSGVLFQRL